MEINIKNETSDKGQATRFIDARPKVQEVSLHFTPPRALHYWSAVSRWLLIIFAGLAPVFFLPFTNLPVAANKEMLIFVLILVSFFALL